MCRVDPDLKSKAERPFGSKRTHINEKEREAPKRASPLSHSPLADTLNMYTHHPHTTMPTHVSSNPPLQASGNAVPYWQLAVAYTTQQTQAMCSIASTTMALNAAHVRFAHTCGAPSTHLCRSCGRGPPRRPGVLGPCVRKRCPGCFAAGRCSHAPCPSTSQIKAPIDPIYAPHAFYTQDDVLTVRFSLLRLPWPGERAPPHLLISSARLFSQVPCVKNLYNKTYINSHGLTLDEAAKVGEACKNGWCIHRVPLPTPTSALFQETHRSAQGAPMFH